MTSRPTNAINFINPPELARPPGYSHVVEIRSGRIVYIAGQVAVDQHGQLVGSGDFEAQADLPLAERTQRPPVAARLCLR